VHVALATNLYESEAPNIKLRSAYFPSLPLWISTFPGVLTTMTILCEEAASEGKGLKDKVQKLLLKHPLSGDVLKQLQLSSAHSREENSIYCLITLCCCVSLHDFSISSNLHHNPSSVQQK
jgi:hypothetical protein